MSLVPVPVIIAAYTRQWGRQWAQQYLVPHLCSMQDVLVVTNSRELVEATRGRHGGTFIDILPERHAIHPEYLGMLRAYGWTIQVEMDWSWVYAIAGAGHEVHAAVMRAITDEALARAINSY